MSRRVLPRSSWRELFKLIPGYDPVATCGSGEWFDESAANNAIRFFAEYLTHVEGSKAGEPFDLEPWQKAIIACAFGWKRKNNTRRYREVFQYVPRKNGKSTLLGGLVNLVAYCDKEPGAQIYSAAADREQATLVFRQAKGMILANPELARNTKIYATYKSIEFPDGSIYKALSAEADTKHGFNTHFVVIDELHAQPNRELVDVLITSTGSRRQPLVWHITTADYSRESVCNEKLQYARKIRDGLISDSSFLPVIYEASVDDDWTDPAVWRKANPNLGISISEDYLARECERARQVPAYENTFKRLHLNIQTEQDVRWLAMDQWDACPPGRSDDELEGKPCFAGLDLSSISDITALVLLFSDGADGYDVRCRFWIPADTAEAREKRDRVPYLTWIRQGFIKTTPGNRIDYRFIRQEINELSREYAIREIAFDPWNAQQIATQLSDEDGFTLVEFRQGTISMNEPCKELERLIGIGKIHHQDNPVLRWMASNVTVKMDESNNIRPDKKRSTEKIDGVVALAMCVGRAMIAVEDGFIEVAMI